MGLVHADGRGAILDSPTARDAPLLDDEWRGRRDAETELLDLAVKTIEVNVDNVPPLVEWKRRHEKLPIKKSTKT